MSHRTQCPITGTRTSRSLRLVKYAVGTLLAAILFPLPHCSASVTKLGPTPQPSLIRLMCPVSLPQERKLAVERVLAHLERAENKEANPHFRDDYRQTWIAIYTADVKGEFDNGWDALVSASYRVIGLHPDKVWPAIIARRQALLGPPAVLKAVRKKTQTVHSLKERKRA